jgi:hypothetical protein
LHIRQGFPGLAAIFLTRRRRPTPATTMLGRWRYLPFFHNCAEAFNGNSLGGGTVVKRIRCLEHDRPLGHCHRLTARFSLDVAQGGLLSGSLSRVTVMLCWLVMVTTQTPCMEETYAALAPSHSQPTLRRHLSRLEG